MKTTFAKNLAEKRKEKGFVQKQIADMLPVKLKTYQAWEEGRGTPPYDILIKLCKTLECTDIYSFLTKDHTNLISNKVA